MDTKERFLPIGTVVMLKGGEVPVMITSYCVYGTKDKEKIYDYGSCHYPQGILNPEIVHAFNHDKIDKVLYKGYETEDSKRLSKILNEGLKKYKEQKEDA